MSDPMIMAGPLFQPIRGVVFALVIYPLRDVVFSRRRGWLLLFWELVALGVVSTFGPTPGSLEGLVYTVIPVRDQLAGYLEVVPQALLLAYGVVLSAGVHSPHVVHGIPSHFLVQSTAESLVYLGLLS